MDSNEIISNSLKVQKLKLNKVMIPNAPEHRGIRLDVEVNEYEENEGKLEIKNIYDVEPNRRKDVNLPRHNRFYQAKIDNRNLVSGENDFGKLPNLFVIMITDYDPFGYDYMMYTVHNKCEEVPELEYEDGLTFIYFNTTGTKGGNSSIKKLLNYIEDSTIKNVTDEVTKKLHDCISKVKVLPEVRMEYMKWDAMIFYERRDAKKEGKIEGKIEVIIDCLEEIGVIPEELREKIEKETDLEQIKKWLKVAMNVNTIEEFIEKM